MDPLVGEPGRQTNQADQRAEGQGNHRDAGTEVLEHDDLVREDVLGDDRSVKIRSLVAAEIMKIKWPVLGCIEANFCN